MEPRIRYAPTADGVSIAYWTLGEGVPLVYMAGGPWGHVELWDIPECRRWYERLAQKRMLVRYDIRGTGWSERNVSDHSLDALVADVEAVVDRLGLDRFAMFGAFDAGPVAIAYAARYPERVSHLILWCSWARSADIRSPRIRAWLGLIDQDWELMTDTCAHLALGWPAGEAGRHAAQRLRESVTPDVARAALEAMGKFDVTALLPRLNAPTLVLHRGEIPWLPVDIARALASRIPDARLIVMEGESTAPYLGDAEATARAVDAFLGERQEGRTARLGARAPSADHEDPQQARAHHNPWRPTAFNGGSRLPVISKNGLDSCEPGQKFIVDSSRIHRAGLMSILMETYDGQDQRSLAPVSGGLSHQGRPLPRPCGPSFSPSHLPAGERIGKP